MTGHAIEVKAKTQRNRLVMRQLFDEEFGVGEIYSTIEFRQTDDDTRTFSL
jgi:hypothetical protein